ncbi:cation-translocating P-type ATPase [Streptomyces lydicus]|uniref:cation-translocating P-type ATPase n=1 Tax=Streptomyces lydicus TaxID=47763 RepID=UPI00369B5C30
MSWYTRSPQDVASEFGVDPASGLSAARGAELLALNGPNALPEQKPSPAWWRFVAQYRSYMQIVLVAAAVVSLLIAQWSTAILLIALTLLNAIVGLRQEGKAESAMNALKSLLTATARVRRDGTGSQIPAEQLVVGDVVLISAGDQVPADGRIIEAHALQIDESALTGESLPAAKGAGTLPDTRLGPGDQSNMASMHTPVTHGSGVVIITATGEGTELGKISEMLSATEKEEPPLSKELNRLTLWITAAAGLTMIVMFALGRLRDQAWDALFISAVSLAIAAIPEALPTVTQAILSVGSLNLAKRNAIVKELPSVETLAFTSAINSDKTGTLTMNQMTAVEVVTPTDRYTVSGTGYGLEGKVHHAAGSAAGIEDAILPDLVANDATLVDGEVVGDPTEGALLVLAHKAGLDIEATRERLSRIATLPFDPDHKLMATSHSAVDASGRPSGAAIARQLGIPGEAVLGADFAALPEHEQRARIDDIGVVGRVAPEHKVLLAATLKKKGDVVAMTGDGVNDAPAIKSASRSASTRRAPASCGAARGHGANRC